MTSTLGDKGARVPHRLGADAAADRTGGVQVRPPSWHEYECFVVNVRQPCAKIAELIRTLSADCAA